jgi:hypothetical protein
MFGQQVAVLGVFVLDLPDVPGEPKDDGDHDHEAFGSDKRIDYRDVGEVDGPGIDRCS